MPYAGGALVFPADALWMQTFILIKIDEPKTRGRAARHQAAKLEPSDLVAIVSLAFERRFDTVLERLLVPSQGVPLDPLT